MVLHASPTLALLLSRVMGSIVGDVVLTKEEVEGVDGRAAGILISTAGQDII